MGFILFYYLCVSGCIGIHLTCAFLIFHIFLKSIIITLFLFFYFLILDSSILTSIVILVFFSSSTAYITITPTELCIFNTTTTTYDANV